MIQETMQVERRPFIGDPNSPLPEGFPAASRALLEIFQEISALADREAITITPERGDIVHINNRAILHARDQYQDADGGDRQLIRWVQRMTVRDTEYGWTIPKPLEALYQDIYAHDPESEDWQFIPEVWDGDAQHG